jgi:hypothetical protein
MGQKNLDPLSVALTNMHLKSTIVRVFDRLNEAYGGSRSRRSTAILLLAILFLSLLLIELNQRGWLPARVGSHVPLNHFVAVEWAVEVLLLFEVIELIFGLARSMDSALGKQLEVFALILLRKSFEELKHFREPIDLSGLSSVAASAAELRPIWHIGADALGALGVFGGLVLYNRLQRHQDIIAEFAEDKKLIALLLLASLAWLTMRELYEVVALGGRFNLFSPIFTALIFSDITIVFLSMRYCDGFNVVFRNFGYTLVTVFVRLAISAPPLPRAAMALGVVLFASAIAWIYKEHEAGEARNA